MATKGLRPQRLDMTIAALAPIHGVSVGTWGNAGTVRIDFKPAATTPERNAAQAALLVFDWSDAAQTQWEDDQNPNRTNVRQQAQNAVDANNAYLAIANPTNAENLAQLRQLTQEVTAVIKRLAEL